MSSRVFGLLKIVQSCTIFQPKGDQMSSVDRESWSHQWMKFSLLIGFVWVKCSPLCTNPSKLMHKNRVVVVTAWKSETPSHPWDLNLAHQQRHGFWKFQRCSGWPVHQIYSRTSKWGKARFWEAGISHRIGLLVLRGFRSAIQSLNAPQTYIQILWNSVGAKVPRLSSPFWWSRFGWVILHLFCLQIQNTHLRRHSSEWNQHQDSFGKGMVFKALGIP